MRIVKIQKKETIYENKSHSIIAKRSVGSMNREEQKQTIKDYLKRLGAGEELESVRTDFVKKFQSVDAAEIMNAEQEPVSYTHLIMKLCFTI